MTVSEWKRIARILKYLYQEIELESAREGLLLSEEEFKTLQGRARERLLSKAGFTMEEYEETRKEVSAEQEVKRQEKFDKKYLAEISDQLQTILNLKVPTEDEIKEIAWQVASEFVKEPEIVKEITKEVITQVKPQTIEKTILKTERVEYDDE